MMMIHGVEAEDSV